MAMARAAIAAIDWMIKFLSDVRDAAGASTRVPVLGKRIVLVGLNDLSTLLSTLLKDQGAAQVSILANGDNEEEVSEASSYQGGCLVKLVNFTSFADLLAAFQEYTELDLVIGCHFVNPVTPEEWGTISESDSHPHPEMLFNILLPRRVYKAATAAGHSGICYVAAAKRFQLRREQISKLADLGCEQELAGYGYEAGLLKV